MASQDYAALFDTAIDKFILVSFEEWVSVIPDLFHVSSTKRRFEEHQGMVGYPLPQARFPGEQIVQGEVHENWNKRYNMRSAGLGDALPLEDVEDDPTGMLTQGAAKIAGGLSASFTDYVETDMASFLINGFSSTSGTPDSKSLFATDHPLSKQDSTSQANRPSSAVDISISAVQAAITNIRTQKAPNGRPMRNAPRVLWYHPQSALHRPPDSEAADGGGNGGQQHQLHQGLQHHSGGDALPAGEWSGGGRLGDHRQRALPALHLEK